MWMPAGGALSYWSGWTLILVRSLAINKWKYEISANLGESNGRIVVMEHNPRGELPKRPKLKRGIMVVSYSMLNFIFNPADRKGKKKYAKLSVKEKEEAIERDIMFQKNVVISWKRPIWKRIIYDEMDKEITDKNSVIQTVNSLRSNVRWGMTGTLDTDLHIPEVSRLPYLLHPPPLSLLFLLLSILFSPSCLFLFPFPFPLLRSDLTYPSSIYLKN